ncbi:hypothetical protein AMS60_02805 [Bacillus sp. FJAT-21945]|nr:hypothetical protein AMS60_02805 [Bacillus sp. FJAT-21945]
MVSPLYFWFGASATDFPEGIIFPFGCVAFTAESRAKQGLTAQKFFLPLGVIRKNFSPLAVAVLRMHGKELGRVRGSPNSRPMQPFRW